MQVLLSHCEQEGDRPTRRNSQAAVGGTVHVAQVPRRESRHHRVKAPEHPARDNGAGAERGAACIYSSLTLLEAGHTHSFGCTPATGNTLEP